MDVFAWTGGAVDFKDLDKGEREHWLAWWRVESGRRGYRG